MAARVRISGGNIDGENNEGIDAQVDAWGNLRTRQGVFKGTYKVYEDSVAGVADFNTHDFAGDTGRNHIVDGWLINDGDGSITVSYSQSSNPLLFGESFTVMADEQIDFLRLDVSRIKVTRGDADASYRMFLI